MSLAVTYVALTGGNTTYKIPTNINSTTNATPNMWITAISGLLEPGEASDESVGMSYSDGSVLDPNPVYAGRNGSIGVVIGGGALSEATIKNTYINFISFLRSGGLTLYTDLTTSTAVNFISLQFDDGGSGGAGYLKFTVNLVTEEAW